MPLTAIDEPGTIDAFGVHFTMSDRGTPVRCHVFRSAIDNLEERPARTAEERLERFQKSRGMFDRLASNLYDAGHRTPWIEVFKVLLED